MNWHLTDEERWRAGVRDAAFGVWDLNPMLDQVHYSPQWKVRLGFPVEELADNTSFWRCRVHPGDLEAMLEALRLHLDGYTGAYEMRFRLRCTNLGYRTVVSRGRVVDRDSRGDATRMVGTMVDVTNVPIRLRHIESQIEPLVRPAANLDRPLHAVLGSGHHASTVSERHLLGLVDDLLDAASREAQRS